MDEPYFLLPPDEKFLCNFHETIECCPIDGTPIKTIEINNALKEDLDKLLCYCKFGVENIDGAIFTKENGCDSLINFGSRETHEKNCRYNPLNFSPSSLAIGNDFYQIEKDSPLSTSFSSPACGGFNSPPPTTTSTTTINKIDNDTTNNSSPLVSFSLIDGSPIFNSNSDTPPTMTTTGTNNTTNYNLKRSTSSNLSSLSTSSSKSSSSNNKKQQQQQPNELMNSISLWESSTQLFFCNRFCPNKAEGCCFLGQTEEDVLYHLGECSFQIMKDKISSLESDIEKRDKEIKILKSSIDQLYKNQDTLNIQESNLINNSTTSKQSNNQTKEITIFSSISGHIFLLFTFLKKKYVNLLIN
eukprot:gene3862-4813_t